jgi:two-component system phosphate regulon sensor histidine kinase PhoR
MVEGVVAVDADERIINLNPAAAELFGIQMTAARGRSLQEVIRNSSLQRFFARVLTENRPMEEDIVLHNAGERRLQAHGTLLKDAAGGRIGALVVLNDVTRLHRLEDMRKEFVANVSHELKTPITSIKGFVETLQDGAVGNHDEAQSFLSIISRQAARLESIIEDLLSLSRIEQETERTETPRSRESIADIVANAVQQCRLKIDEKRINIVVECSEKLAAHVNAPLLEQAVINLLDNAVKYSPAETSVRISAREDGSEVILAVQDNGCGIPQEHLPRIFERFYRVDKARSRQLGGTGLGLSIVKHIVQAHGGRVQAESRVGRGSTFTVVLPRTAQDGVVVDAHA